MSEGGFPLNAWHAAAYDVEVGRGLLARRICDLAMVFYRRQDGSPAAPDRTRGGAALCLAQRLCDVGQQGRWIGIAAIPHPCATS